MKDEEEGLHQPSPRATGRAGWSTNPPHSFKKSTHVSAPIGKDWPRSIGAKDGSGPPPRKVAGFFEIVQGLSDIEIWQRR